MGVIRDVMNIIQIYKCMISQLPVDNKSCKDKQNTDERIPCLGLFLNHIFTAVDFLVYGRQILFPEIIYKKKIQHLDKNERKAMRNLRKSILFIIPAHSGPRIKSTGLSETGAGIYEALEKTGFLLEFTLAKAGAGMTILQVFRKIQRFQLLDIYDANFTIDIRSLLFYVSPAFKRFPEMTAAYENNETISF